MSCVGLAIAISGSAEAFQSSFDQTRELLASTEVVTPEMVDSLQVAIDRAENAGMSDRAMLVRELAAAT
jgi:hypothetical protein